MPRKNKLDVNFSDLENRRLLAAAAVNAVDVNDVNSVAGEMPVDSGGNQIADERSSTVSEISPQESEAELRRAEVESERATIEREQADDRIVQQLYVDGKRAAAEYAREDNQQAEDEFYFGIGDANAGDLDDKFFLASGTESGVDFSVLASDNDFAVEQAIPGGDPSSILTQVEADAGLRQQEFVGNENLLGLLTFNGDDDVIALRQEQQDVIQVFKVELGDGSDSFRDLPGSTESVFVIGGTGQDSIETGRGEDFIITGEPIEYEALPLGDGDYYEIFDNAGNTANSGAGNDIVYNSPYSPGDNVNLGAGNDSAILFGGDNNVRGGAGSDLILTGPGNDVVRGGAGDDAILTTDGEDRLFGGAGDDVLAGGRGLDRISAGAGNDTAYLFDDEDEEATRLFEQSNFGETNQFPEVIEGVAPEDFKGQQFDFGLTIDNYADIDPAAFADLSQEEIDSFRGDGIEFGRLTAVLADGIESLPSGQSLYQDIAEVRDSDVAGLLPVYDVGFGGEDTLGRVSGSIPFRNFLVPESRDLTSIAENGPNAPIELLTNDSGRPFFNSDSDPNLDQLRLQIFYRDLATNEDFLNSPLTSFGHELTHVQQNVTGSVPPGSTLSTNRAGEQSLTPNFEFDAVGLPYDVDGDTLADPESEGRFNGFFGSNENEIREDLGLEPRASYGGRAPVVDSE